MRTDRPKSLEELHSILKSASEAPRLIAGGTDLALRIRRHPEENPYLVDISHLEELRGIVIEKGTLKIGASVTFDELEKSPLVREYARSLSIAASMVGSPQIRNRGTIGGNVANASAAADGVTALCSLGAEAVIEDADGEREILPVEKVILSRGRTIVGARRFFRFFGIPIAPKSYSDFAKVGSRKAVTISKLNVALATRLDGKKLMETRIFVGAVSSTPTRAIDAESIIASDDRSASKAFLDSLSTLVETTIPTRSSMPYKRKAIRGLGDDLWTRLAEELR